MVNIDNFLFLSMDPLYPSGLDENRAVDELYRTSGYVVKLLECRVQNSKMSFSVMYKGEMKKNYKNMK